MQVRFFTIPVHGGEDAADQLNRFLASHRVVAGATAQAAGVVVRGGGTTPTPRRWAALWDWRGDR